MRKELEKRGVKKRKGEKSPPDHKFNFWLHFLDMRMIYSLHMEAEGGQKHV